jgi:D-inositol-3-phosphate glycosyltransferase
MPQFVDGVKHFAAEKGIHYDLIHSHYWMSGMAALALKQEWNVPILQMFHTLGLMKNRIAQSLSEIETGARIDGEMRLLQEVDCVVAATQAELSQMTFLYKITPKRHIILPPGVDLARFYPIPEDEAKEAIGIPTDNCLFLFVGRIEPLKGLPTLLKAVAILKEKGILSCCSYRLAIVGGDPSATLGEISAEMARLQNLSHELGLDELVIFLGKRDQEALPYYYSAAEVVIVPSHYESFGMVALEAMACGTPVVASQVGGLAFLVQDGVTGYVVPDNQPELLAEKLAHLISQPEVRQEMGSKAAAIARNYSWQNIAEQISVVYQQLVG